MAKIELTTAPTIEPVTLSELRVHLRIDSSDEERDKDILSWQKTARQHVEQTILHRALLNQTYTQFFDNFANPLRLRWPKLSSITSVKYTLNDSSGTLTTVATSVYEAGEWNGIGIVRRKFEQEWPTDARLHPDSVQVAFVAGYGSASSDVPAPIRHAIKVMVADMYQHPESIALGTTAIPIRHSATVRDLLAAFKIVEVP